MSARNEAIAAVALSVTEQHLLDAFQRDLPLVPEPFAEMAVRLGITESRVRELLRRLRSLGMVSRVGAVCRSQSLGASTLAAMAVPAQRLHEVAGLVNSYREVNHNYEREHHLNLWFVANARTQARLREVLAEIEARSGVAVVALPMVEDYHIDLGFALDGGRIAERPPTAASAPVSSARAGGSAFVHAPRERRLIEVLEHGFPLVPRPYREIGRRIGMSESDVIAGLKALLERGVIKRMGVIVRHHELGYRANAMVVWDVPDEEVGVLGRRMAQCAFVTLCYRRERHAQWPYNLYCMIHGRDRTTVHAQLEKLVAECGLERVPRQVLFSGRRFKQRGALYSRSADEAAAA
jgi:DNA-binding Lrp family transcriptional regulator